MTGAVTSFADLTRPAFRALNRVVAPLVKAGVGSPPPVGFGLMLLESTGRISGATREVPVLGFRMGDRAMVSTVRSDSQWLRNLEVDDRAGVWFCGRRRDATAAVQRGTLNIVELATV